MRSLTEYFLQSSAPAGTSPVGTTMVKVLSKFPDIGFEEARARAKELLNRAAGSRVYRVPPILSERELVAQRERLMALNRGKVAA